jgi:hypothetical protein
MSRIKSIFAVLVVAAIVGIVPRAFAANPTVEVVLAGSSAIWQTAAVAAYNNGVSLSGGTATHHWTSKSNAIQLVDTRPSLVGGSNNVDLGTLWVVWDTPTTGQPHVWAMLKVDSIVGARCYFARPACTELGTTNGSTGTLDVAGNKINLPNTAWGSNNDMTLPGTGTTGVLGIFAGGEGTLNHVGAAASDIRVEDAQFGACRANSALGADSVLNTSDALDGLGYNAANPSGACPAGTVTLAQGVGSPIASGVFPATGATANPLAFNIIGHDPFSGTAEPAFKTINVGGEPMVFIVSRENNLKGVHDVSMAQLQQVFSGANCDASALGGTWSKGINIFLREPLSGTMNTVEATVFRRPTVDGGAGNTAIGISQETNVGLNNPLQGQAGTCVINPSGTSARYRGVGTGEVVDNGVCASNNDNAANCKVTGTYPTAQDGIAYTFFSYGNISKEANQDEYGYLTLNGIDPIFSSYGNQVKTGAPFDPGQPADGAAGGPGLLPGAANLPAGCESGSAGFPCSEDLIWAGNPTASGLNPPSGLSFPNLRNGSYPAWGILRVISDSGTGGQYGALFALITASNKTAVGFVPDYVPLASVASFCSPSGKVPPCVAPDHTVPKDPGMTLLRSHYAQKDGAGVAIGCATAVNSGSTECGGDMGGRILSSTAANQKTVTQNVQGTNGFQIRP